jgi:hypothetical protein
MNGYLFAALAAAIATACSQGEQGVTQAQADNPVIAISEGACLGPCPVYEMTLRPDGSYILHGARFVKTSGVSEGKLGEKAWTRAQGVLEAAGFWTLQPVQTLETLPNCQTDAPTVKVTWRTAEGKEKTVTYNAGCGVRKMQDMISELREAIGFGDLVWTEDRFDPSGNR